MEENIKTIRFIHRAILLMSTAIIGFAQSIEQPASESRIALAEFRQIEPVLDSVNHLHNHQTNEFYEEEGVLSVFREEFSDLDISELNVAVALDDMAAMPVYEYGTKPPIKAVHQYLVKKENFERLPVWHVDLNSLRTGIRMFRDRTTDIIGISTIFLSADRPDDWDGEPYRHHEWRLSIGANFTKSDGSEEILTITQEGISIRHNGFERLKPDAANSYLRDVGIVVDIDGEPEALPKLRDVWSEIRDLDMGVVEATLRRKAQAERLAAESSLEIGGVKFSRAVSVILAPIILIVMMLYLLSHIRHLRSICHQNGGELEGFPWVGLFSDALGRLLSGVSFFLIPIAATSTLLYMSGTNHISSLWLGLIYAVIIETIAVALYLESRKLRRQVKRLPK